MVEDGSLVEEGDVVARFDSSEMQERLDRGLTELQQNELRIDKTTTNGESRISQTRKDHTIAVMGMDSPVNGRVHPLAGQNVVSIEPATDAGFLERIVESCGEFLGVGVGIANET